MCQVLSSEKVNILLYSYINGYNYRFTINSAYTLSDISGWHPNDQLWIFQPTRSKLDPKPPYIMAGSSQIAI